MSTDVNPDLSSPQGGAKPKNDGPSNQRGHRSGSSGSRGPGNSLAGRGGGSGFHRGKCSSFFIRKWRLIFLTIILSWSILGDTAFYIIDLHSEHCN